MFRRAYFILSNEQIDKIGNAIIYLSDAIGPLSKTKILKLLYILDELAIRKSGIPFFNIPYKVWKLGPVSEDIFVDLSTDLSKLKPFITRTPNDYFESLVSFNDDEFSNNDIKLMDEVIGKYGGLTAEELISFSHREDSPWYIAAVENKVLDLLTTEVISNTEFLIDFSSLLSTDDTKKMIYQEYLEMH